MRKAKVSKHAAPPEVPEAPAAWGALAVEFTSIHDVLAVGSGPGSPLQEEALQELRTWLIHAATSPGFQELFAPGATYRIEVSIDVADSLQIMESLNELLAPWDGATPRRAKAYKVLALPPKLPSPREPGSVEPEPTRRTDGGVGVEKAPAAQQNTATKSRPLRDAKMPSRSHSAGLLLGEAVAALEQANAEGALPGSLRERIAKLVGVSAKAGIASEPLVQSSGGQPASSAGLETNDHTHVGPKDLEAKVLACKLDYQAAFALIHDEIGKVDRSTIEACLQTYLNKVSELLLAKPEGRGRGNFGSLPENKAFTMALNRLLDLTNLRICTAFGPAKLHASRQPRGRAEGRFQYMLRSDKRGSFPEVPRLSLTPLTE